MTVREGPALDGSVLVTASAVLLDMDGTLVRSEHVHRQAWWQFLDDWGVTVSEDEYERHYVGRRASDVLAERWLRSDPRRAGNQVHAGSDS